MRLKKHSQNDPIQSNAPYEFYYAASLIPFQFFRSHLEYHLDTPDTSLCEAGGRERETFDNESRHTSLYEERQKYRGNLTVFANKSGTRLHLLVRLILLFLAG